MISTRDEKRLIGHTQPPQPLELDLPAIREGTIGCEPRDPATRTTLTRRPVLDE